MEYITISNNHGLEITLCTIGASILDIKVPDKNNVIESVVAHPNKEVFPYATSHFGKTCGRTGGRISNKMFKIDNTWYTINSNDPNALHGGIFGFAFKDFEYKVEKKELSTDVIFFYHSKDMESGYPGNMDVSVIYSISMISNDLKVTYNAISDKKTLCNMTNHTYYNLSGNTKRNILDENLFINASNFGYIENANPKEIRQVNELFNFKDFHQIGKYINNEQILKYTNGYDHPFVFDKNNKDIPQVILFDEDSGRKLEMYTDYDVAVIYTCNYPENITLPNGNRLRKHDAICIEAQNFPNSINSEFIKNKKDLLDPNSLLSHFFLLKFTA